MISQNQEEEKTQGVFDSRFFQKDPSPDQGSTK